MKNNIYFIRHGRTYANEEYKKCYDSRPLEERTFIMPEYISQKNLFHTHLVPDAINKCKDLNQTIYKDMHVDIIFVTPLLRTIETAMNLFEGNKYFDNNKLICIPPMAEGVHAFSDIGKSLSEMQEEFNKSDFTKYQYGINNKSYDNILYDSINSLQESIELFKNKETWIQFVKPLYDKHNELNTRSDLYKEMENAYPTILEDMDSFILRAKKMTKCVLEYVEQEYKDKTIVFINHAGYIKRGFSNDEWMDNLEMRKVNKGGFKEDELQERMHDFVLEKLRN